ncbi:hypothetical protein ScalyP_jg5136 [Parmales sp. scaly parma]|nr:hypothetical protein ScalyP_jg5136 [Parmales sp. scaly parma]
MSANFLYLTSINICDRIYLARDDYSKQRPLADLGYFLIPMDARFQLFTDFFAAASIFVICTSLILARDMKNVTVGLRDITIGKIVSMTCHCSTQLPDSREPGFVNGFPLLGYQGLTDRIMSNHIFEFGTALHIATMYFPKKFPTFLRIVILAMYTLAMVSSRGHYTVDCVLAWWTLAATGRLGMDTKVFKVMRIGENARGKGKTEVPLTTEEKLARAFLGFIFACSCCSVW